MKKITRFAMTFCVSNIRRTVFINEKTVKSQGVHFQTGITSVWYRDHNLLERRWSIPSFG